MKKFLATILSVILLLTIIPMAYAEESNTYKVGDIIQFGSYPQSEVKDEALIAELNALAPEWDEWISYGYYESSEQGDWMRYTDIDINGNRYRGVKFKYYRPDGTYRNFSGGTSEQRNNDYYPDIVYWFKFDPIFWRVLAPDTGLVMCEIIIDSQPYSNTVYQNDGISDYWNSFFNDALYTNYASDYETSHIRKWLKTEFYNTAFNDNEKEKINITNLNNDGYFTSQGISGKEFLDSNETNDKIFLLSYNEVKNSDYGFSSDENDYDDARRGFGSDYAKCQGLRVYKNNGEASIYNGYSCWIIRSPGSSSNSCCYVYDFGYSSVPVEETRCTFLGIRPALRVNDISTMECVHIHKYSPTTTPPTCTTQGYTTYTCACGDSYIADYVNALGHKDNNGDYKCDYNCGYEYEKPAPENPDTPEVPSKDCSCNCHKGGIMGFFWKIINFFNKLFKSKQYCGCGAKHW